MKDQEDMRQDEGPTAEVGLDPNDLNKLMKDKETLLDILNQVSKTPQDSALAPLIRYASQIKSQLDFCKWQPPNNKYSSVDLCNVQSV